ncbi:MAG: hypothetical protein KKH98_12565 [Spirochaetes bacterium]|nr:hypothetical protein [Spirochaetota bacterium]
MQQIVTHTDFDGVVSGALLSIATEIRFIRFISHSQIWREPLSGTEVIADLPCPWTCQLWFDHHETNLKEMKQRGVKTEEIPGRFQLLDSCAHVIYDHYHEQIEFPDHFKEMIPQTDQIDSMNYQSVDEWLKETPVKMIASTTQLLKDEDYKSFLKYLLKLTKQLTKSSPIEIIQSDVFTNRYESFKNYKEYSLELLRKNHFFHPDDKNKAIALIDLSEFKTSPRMDKNFIYMIEPDADAVLLINSAFQNNVKTNTLKFSFGVNFTRSEKFNKVNAAKIFEELDIGGGHPKAAGGSIECESKKDKLKIKDYIIKEIIKRWNQQLKTEEKVIS